MDGFGSRFIAETFGIPVSALHYWDKTNLIKPSVRPAAGRGSRRLYSFRDLVQLLVVFRLRERDLSLQRIRTCLTFLRRHFPDVEDPLASLSMVTDGESLFLLTDDPNKVLDTLREQFVWSVPIAAWLRCAQETVERATSPRTEEMRVDGRTFTVSVQQDPEDGWWVGLVEELPGCGSQGNSLDELRDMVADAIHECLVSRGEVPGHGEEDAQPAAV